MYSRRLKAQHETLNGEQSANAEATRQTEISLIAALEQMNAAWVGMQDAGYKMNDAAYDFKIALKKWQTDQIVSFSIDLASGLANLAILYGVVRTDEADPSDWSWFFDTAIGLIDSQSAYYIFNTASSFQGTWWSFVAATNAVNHFMKDFPQQVADLSSQVQAKLNKTKLPPNPFAKKDPSVALTQAANQLTSKLLSLGSGAWSEFVAANRRVYNDFLSGYSGAVSGAAQHFIDQLEVQAKYGNDYVSAGTRFVKGVQQYLVNLKQAQAYNETQNALAKVYNSTKKEEAYDMMQEGVLVTQITTVAVQMHTTMEQLCQSLNYQTTRLYQQCMNEEDDNPLKSLCAPFADGSAAFTPFLYSAPCQKGVGLASAAQAYLVRWKRVYTNAKAVINFVTNAVWGTDKSADDIPFQLLTLKVWDPPPCNASVGHWVSRVSICNASIPESPPHIVFVPEGACKIPPNRSKGYRCCNITRWQMSCDRTPPEVPHIRRSAFDAFVNKSSESWGKLSITLTQKQLQHLLGYDEVFVRGIATFLEGATEDPHEASRLNFRWSATGAMQTKVMRQKWFKEKACHDAFLEDLYNLCMFNNYSFWGVPNDQSQLVTYTSYYSSTKSDGITCAGGLSGTPVFSGKRELECGDSPCFHYCSNLDFGSLDQGDVRAMYRSSSSPYNFASIYSGWNLQVYNQFDASQPVSIRGRGIDLTGVRSIRVAMWLKTNGKNNQKLLPCSQILGGS